MSAPPVQDADFGVEQLSDGQWRVYAAFSGPGTRTRHYSDQRRFTTMEEAIEAASIWAAEFAEQMGDRFKRMSS